MATEQYVVVTPTGVQLPLASQEWVGQKVTEAQIQDNAYADNAASVALASANSHADTVVAETLAELLPVFPTPPPPVSGPGQITATEEDGTVVIFRDQIYTDSVGFNASATAIAQANAFSIIKVNDATNAVNARTDAEVANALQDSKLYTDQVKGVLEGDITTSRIASQKHTDDSIAELKSNQSWVSIAPSQVTNLDPAIAGFGYIKEQAVKFLDEQNLILANDYTDEKIAEVVVSGFTFEQFLTYIDEMDAS